ncbi:C-3 sterol dehydrogenase/C-4 decarboxylase [Mytilinidion resinicola]|uniref:C-3 sterol dehydrogenase/C-4 decarboxylase n=1 Tax=Mytilinidion resinicola TaxID=574789 RepID=A0A6A6YUW0_9PEZI|nr:C-3 sterol dehydrogenase/C-4 decarboxylase [Mytilinidion resinicola]KAF2812746.1 C-3 sterol dehydrogenase/C-4 decarboxylase [Mytilinidion resinicola]
MAASNESLGSVLVIGGCGFLGRHLVEGLRRSDDASTLTVFDLTNSNSIEGIKYIAGSITSRDEVLAVLNDVKPEVIFDLASPYALVRNLKLLEDVNIHRTRNLLECSQQCGFTKALVYTSSSSVIHNSFTDLVMATEDRPLVYLPEQKELYTHTKAVAEHMVLSANGKGGMLANLFDFTYVGNNTHPQILLAQALVRILTEPLAEHPKVDSEAFAITNDDLQPFWDFTRALAGAAGYPMKKSDVLTVPKSVAWMVATITEWVFFVFTLGKKDPRLTRKKIKYSTMTRTLDITKAKERLGYQPQVSLQEGMAMTAKWYKDVSDGRIKESCGRLL